MILRNYSFYLFFLLTASVFLSSCNVVNYRTKKIHKKLEKLGQVEWNCRSDSSSIHIRKVGNGDRNLLLLHGFGPAPEMQWKDIVEYLYTDFTIYIPDIIYFGESTSDSENYDPRFISRQIFNCLNKEDLENLYVAGLSFGGFVASIYASENSESVDGLILIAALSKFSNRSYSDSLALASGYENFSEILMPSDGKSLKMLFDLSFSKPKRYPAWMLNKPAKVLYSNQRNEKEELITFLTKNENEIKSWDYSYNGKVQIIWGEEDLIIPVKHAYSLAEYYDNSNFTILPEVGHVVTLENPSGVSEIIRSFIHQVVPSVIP